MAQAPLNFGRSRLEREEEYDTDRAAAMLGYEVTI